MDKKLLWVWILVLASCGAHGEEERRAFNYESVWRIVYFKANEQFVNQRPEQDNNPNQGFNYIYNILIKYTHSFAPASDAESQMLGSFLVDAEKLFLINEDGYQVIYIGDHFISDGFGSAALQDDDYQQLINILLVRKNRTGDVFNGQLEETLKRYSDDAKRHMDASRDSTLVRPQDKNQDQGAKKTLDTSPAKNDEIQAGSSQGPLVDHNASPRSEFKASSESAIDVAQQLSENKSSLSSQGQAENHGDLQSNHSSTGYLIKISGVILGIAALFFMVGLLRRRQK